MVALWWLLMITGSYCIWGFFVFVFCIWHIEKDNTGIFCLLVKCTWMDWTIFRRQTVVLVWPTGKRRLHRKSELQQEVKERGRSSPGSAQSAISFATSTKHTQPVGSWSSTTTILYFNFFLHVCLNWLKYLDVGESWSVLRSFCWLLSAL